MSSFSESDWRRIEHFKSSPGMRDENFRKDLQDIIDKRLPLVQLCPNGITVLIRTPRMGLKMTPANKAMVEMRQQGLPPPIQSHPLTRSAFKTHLHRLQNVIHSPTNSLASFTRKISSSDLSKGRLPIPTQFWNKHLKKWYKLFSDVEFIFQGRVWIVSLKNEGKRYLVQRGFTAFARDVSLEIGSVCKFELMDSDAIMKFVVTIQS